MRMRSIRLPSAVIVALALCPLACGGSGSGSAESVDEPEMAPLAEEMRTEYSALEIPGLIAYLPCDGNANDAGPNAHDGIVSGSGLVEDRFGYRRGAYYFDGVNDSIGFESELLGGRDAFSVSLWMMSDSDTSGALLFEGDLTTSAFFLRSNPGQNRLVAKVDGHFNTKFNLPNEVQLHDGQWHHVVLVARRSGGLSLFVDRQEVGRDDTVTWDDWDAGSTQLGRLGQPDSAGSSNNMLFVGRMDDIALYDRAISEADVKALFKDGPNRAPLANAGEDKTVYDASVVFDGTASGDSDGDIVSYAWDFGDGNTGDGAQATHQYAEAGVYTVTLTVTDDEGETSEDTVVITVNAPGTPDSSWPAEWAALEDAVVIEVNKVRAAGTYCAQEWHPPVGPVEMNEVIRIAARLHSEDMAKQGYFAHASLDGRTFSDRMTEAGFSGPGPWGENIATGYTNAAAVVAGWVSSPGHCRNLMAGDYRVMGIGYYYLPTAPTKSYWTQNFAGGH